MTAADDTTPDRQLLDALARLRVLAEASRAFAAAKRDLRSVLDAVAGHVMTGIGDSCTIMLTSSDGEYLTPMVIRHRDPEAEKATWATLSASPVRIGVAESRPGQVAKTGKAVRIPAVTVPGGGVTSVRAEYQEHLRRFPLHSLMIVPIRSGGGDDEATATTIGIIATGRSTPDRPYSADDESLLSDIADRAALAIGHARAYEADLVSRERLTRLQSLVSSLATALLHEEVARIAVVEGCVTTAAQSGLFYELDPRDGYLRLTSQNGVPASFLEGLSEIAPDSPLPGATVARTRTPVWIEDQEQYAAGWPELAAHAKAANRLSAFAAVPMLVDNVCLGVLAFGFSEATHRFDEADRAFMTMLGHHCAQALNRTRVLERERMHYARVEESARRAEEASRLKDEFLASVSHELRTPLSAVLGWATILKKDQRTDPAVIMKGIEVIERNARSQLHIIDDILDVSRIVRGELRISTEPIDLEELGAEVLESVRPSANAKGITIEMQSQLGKGDDRSPAAKAPILGDPERLRQILWNLLSNAVKFTGEGGRVELVIRRESDDKHVALSVRDTGCGIDGSFLPYVFDRFRQADSSTTRTAGGLGLGLAIVRYLAEIHGGTAAAASDGLGKGASFTVTLPIRPGTPVVAALGEESNEDGGAPLSRRASQSLLRGLRILLVEDDPDGRELLRMVLTEEGAEVETAASAEDALAKLTSFDAQVLVSDIGMPVHDGYWLVQHVRESHPTLPAVALTAYARREDARRAKAAGFDHHVGKPVDATGLIQVICRAVGRASSS